MICPMIASHRARFAVAYAAQIRVPGRITYSRHENTRAMRSDESTEGAQIDSVGAILNPASLNLSPRVTDTLFRSGLSHLARASRISREPPEALPEVVTDRSY